MIEKIGSAPTLDGYMPTSNSLARVKWQEKKTDKESKPDRKKKEL